MSRRKKQTEPRSTTWESYRPQDPLYWRMGGPFVPVDVIEAEPYSPEFVASHVKSPVAKTRFLVAEIERMEKDLDESIAYYLKLQELGIDAMKLAFYRDQDREMDARPGDWMMVARNVDRHWASTYQNIRFRRGQIATYRNLLGELDAQTMPLTVICKNPKRGA